MNGIPVARILGFEIRLPLSWVFVVAVITVTVGSRLTSFLPGTSEALSWTVGLGASLVFLVTVIVHELAHAVVARRDGADTTVLVVQFIGSPAAVDVIASSPRAEAAIALAGPASSAVLGGASVALALALLTLGSALEPVADGLLIVGALDLLLVVVSLVPAFPLDGARAVRAIAWARTGNRRSGTRIAGVIGRYAGRVILVVGFAIAVIYDQTLLLDGVMLGLAGWFLIASARTVDRWLVLDDLIQGMSVADAMEDELSTVSPQLTLDTFASGVLDGSVTPALPVLECDVLVGIVGVAQVRAVARRNWSATRTSDVMVVPPTMPTARPEDRLTDALERLRKSHLDGLPVLDGDTLSGVLTRRSIAALLHARAESRGLAI